MAAVAAAVVPAGDTNARTGGEEGAPSAFRIFEILSAGVGGRARYATAGHVQFQMGTHAWVHGAVGGFMASNRSPADPIFWGHHGFVDYIWDMWSRYHTCNQDSGLQHLVGAVYDEVVGRARGSARPGVGGF